MSEQPTKLASSGLSEGAQRILEVAIDLFAEHGVDGVSIARIATEAGVSKATVFHHFASKEALHRSVLWQVNERAMWLVEDRSWDDGDLEDCMAGFIRDQLAQFAESDSLLRLVRREVLEGDEQVLDQISEVILEPFNRLKAHLDRRLEQGDLPANVDTHLLAWLLLEVGVSYHEGACVLARIPGFDLAKDPERFSRQVARLIIHGCLCESGEDLPQSSQSNHEDER